MVSGMTTSAPGLWRFRMSSTAGWMMPISRVVRMAMITAETTATAKPFHRGAR